MTNPLSAAVANIVARHAVLRLCFKPFSYLQSPEVQRRDRELLSCSWPKFELGNLQAAYG